MEASQACPIYTAFVISGGKKYDITPAVVEIDISDQKGQIAKSVDIQLVNVLVDNVWLTSIIKVRDRVFLYADDGTTKDEVFRGYVWTRSYRSALNDWCLRLRCYDNLIYLQESDDSDYFSDGKSTKDVMQSICDKWGIKLDYTYESITNSKLVLRGCLSDIITDDVLDLVKDRTGTKYVILSEKDTMIIRPVASNKTIYSFIHKENAINTNSECTMDGMTTKVVILGKADDDERKPVEATVDGDTSTYGTLQKIIDRDENTSLEDAKKEAQSMIDEDGTPTWEYEVEAPDIPWIRKGDKVYVNAGDIYQTYLAVVGIERTIGGNKSHMTMTLEKLKGTESKTDTATSSTTEFKIGDTVNFTGSRHYVASTSDTGYSCKPGKATIYNINKGAKHPYSLIRVDGGESTVYGWVDEQYVQAI